MKNGTERGTQQLAKWPGLNSSSDKGDRVTSTIFTGVTSKTFLF